MHRRMFLQLLAAGSATVGTTLLPGCADRAGSVAPPAARFFTAGERQVIEQLGAAILPEDETVGALGADAVEYVDRLLATFDQDPPPIYRGGPASGRWPFPDASTGLPSDEYPDDAFEDVLPPTRMQELGFRILLDGSASVPGGEINAPIVPPSPGWRALYRDGVSALLDAAGVATANEFAALPESARLAAFAATDARFQEALLSHLAEGMFGAPEYGGNRGLAGWRDFHYDGDSQPLGHTLYDRRTGTLFDRPDQPNQTLDPALPNDGLEPRVEAFLATLVPALGGKRFF